MPRPWRRRCSPLRWGGLSISRRRSLDAPGPAPGWARRSGRRAHDGEDAWRFAGVANQEVCADHSTDGETESSKRRHSSEHKRKTKGGPVAVRMSVAERERYVISPPLNETREQLRSTSFTPVTLATARTGPQRVGQRVARVRDATFTPNRLPRLLTGRGPNGDSQPLRSFSVLHSISRAIPNTPVQSQKSQLVCRWTGSLDCSTATSCHVPFHARRLDDRVRYLYPI